MGRIDLTLPEQTKRPPGCPSGLQIDPVDHNDPMANAMDFTPYVTSAGQEGYSLDLIVKGAHCGGCLAKIENGLSAMDNVTRARMNLSTLRLNVAWTGETQDANTIVERLQELGFGAAPYEINSAGDSLQSESRSLLRAMAVAGFAAMNVMLLSIAVWSGGADMSPRTHDLFHWISALIALPAVAYSGQVFFKSAAEALRARRTNMDVPISLALILACGLSVYETINSHPDTYFDAAVMLLFLLLIGRYLDARLRFQTGEAARRLAALQVTSATRLLPSGQIETVPARSINPGDEMLVPAGQRLAVDCIIVKGQSDIDMQIATGETKPQSYGPGDTLYSGTTNLTAPLTVRAIAKYSDSFLSEITQLVELGEQKKGHFVRIADRAARAYVPVVHTIALLTFVGWLAIGGDLRTAALNAIAVLIITCPCALGLAVPAVQIVASGRLFKQGVLLKSGDALERLAKTRYVIFDKTGTLTEGRFALSNKADITDEDQSLIAALSQHSTHPLSRALSRELKGQRAGIDLSNIKEHPGEGISATLDGIAIRLGSQSFTGAQRGEHKDGVGTTVWLCKGTRPATALHMVDVIRADAGKALERLRAQNLDMEMLSGDAAPVAKAVGAALGLERARGEVSPREKMHVTAQLMSEGRYPLMVGDGINDAPALAAAYCSASLAGAADVSRASADIILQGDRLTGLPDAIETARLAQRRVIENLTLAVCYNFIAIPLAVFGFVNPLIAALAMSGSSLLVTLNALRMAKFGASK